MAVVHADYRVTIVANSYLFVGPSSGQVGTMSPTFAVTPNGLYTGTITITPSGGGLSTPIVLSWSNSLAPQTFTIDPTTTGSVVLTPTNSGGLADQPALTYVSGLTLPYSDDFEADLLGVLPAGWSNYDSGGQTLAAVVDESALSPLPVRGTRGISTNGQHKTQVWLTTAVDRDVAVSATMQMFSSPGAACTGLFARVSNPGANPTCYALLLSRNCQPVTLYRYNAGIATQIGTISSVTYITSGENVTVTLSCTAGQIRAKVYIASGAHSGNYIQPDGTLTANNSWCLTIDDTANMINAGGFVGMMRTLNVTTNDYWNDFSVVSSAGDTTPPVVSLTSPVAGATLTGTFTLSATATDTGSGVASVSWLVDGIPKATVITPPYTTTLNSASWANGSHTIRASALDNAGNVGLSSTITVTSSNATAVVRPTIANAQTHLKTEIICYSGTPAFTADDITAAGYLDFSTTDPSQITNLRSLRPAMHQMLYSNLFTLGLGQLADWLTYAYEHSYSPEDGFWHAVAPYTYTGTGQGYHKCRKFWAMFSGTASPWTDLRGSQDAATSVTFPGTSGQSFYAGNLDPWRELNLGTVTRSPSGGWAYVLEYCSAADGTGTATTWSTLTTISDTTAGFTTAGVITFDPPANWIPARIAGQYSFSGPPETGVSVNYLRHYYIRVRVTNSGTSPIASEVFSRDFYGSGYTQAGTVPVFDTTADANGDGYLNDAEYPNRATGKNARFLYESRLVSQYGDERYFSRSSQPSFSAWAVAYHLALIAANSDFNGLMIDNSFGTPHGISGYTLEPLGSAASDYGLVLNSIWRAMPNHATMGQRWVLANVGGAFQADIEAMIPFCPAYSIEFGFKRPDPWITWESLANQLATYQGLTSPAPIGAHDVSTEGETSDAAYLAVATTPSIQIWALAVHYMTAADNLYWMWMGGVEPTWHWSYKFFQAWTYNVGTPTEAWSMWQTGTDPDTSVASNLVYKVYKRQYTNVLILLKPASYLSPRTGTLNSATATTHGLTTLNAAGYKPLNADGTLGAVITSITLQNGQGAILIPQ